MDLEKNNLKKKIIIGNQTNGYKEKSSFYDTDILKRGNIGSTYTCITVFRMFYQLLVLK